MWHIKFGHTIENRCAYAFCMYGEFYINLLILYSAVYGANCWNQFLTSLYIIFYRLPGRNCSGAIRMPIAYFTIYPLCKSVFYISNIGNRLPTCLMFNQESLYCTLLFRSFIFTYIPTLQSYVEENPNYYFPHNSTSTRI